MEIFDIIVENPIMSFIALGMVFFYFGRVTTNKETGEENVTSGQGVTSLDADTQVSNYIGHEVNIEGKNLTSYEEIKDNEGTEHIIETEDEETHTIFSLFRKSK